jgi:maltose O-acetyltransferase
VIGRLYSLIAKLYHLVDDYRYRARIKVLMDRGLTVGRNVTISKNAVIDTTYPYLISIGDNCSIAEHVRVLAHDAATFKFLDGHTRLGKVEIKDNCFIGDRSTILPGVAIGPSVLVAAGSVVNRDIPPNSCVAGVPARVYGKFDEYLERNRQQIQDGGVFEFSLLANQVDNLDETMREAVREVVQNGRPAYVKGYTGRNPYTWNLD